MKTRHSGMYLSQGPVSYPLKIFRICIHAESRPHMTYNMLVVR